MRRWVLVGLALAGCSDRSDPLGGESAGSQLEAAAISTGMVVDVAKASIVGSWARDTDRLCVVPEPEGTDRIGALVDYGEGQGCAASGTVRRSGRTLYVAFGQCRFEAVFDGERIVFPAALPGACDSLCIGRAELAALAVDRLSTSASEAAMLRTATGKPLCAS